MIDKAVKHMEFWMIKNSDEILENFQLIKKINNLHILGKSRQWPLTKEIKSITNKKMNTCFSNENSLPCQKTWSFFNTLSSVCYYSLSKMRLFLQVYSCFGILIADCSTIRWTFELARIMMGKIASRIMQLWSDFPRS